MSGVPAPAGPAPYFEDDTVQLFLGNCVEVLPPRSSTKSSSTSGRWPMGRPLPLTGVFDIDETAWMMRAACAGIRDPDLFFPESTAESAYAPARDVCDRCPVAGDCLDYALAHGENFGVWGGLTPPERRRLRRARTKAATGG